MAKFENYRDYSEAGTAIAEKALLTAWDSLAPLVVRWPWWVDLRLAT